MIFRWKLRRVGLQWVVLTANRGGRRVWKRNNTSEVGGGGEMDGQEQKREQRTTFSWPEPKPGDDGGGGGGERFDDDEDFNRGRVVFLSYILYLFFFNHERLALYCCRVIIVIFLIRKQSPRLRVHAQWKYKSSGQVAAPCVLTDARACVKNTRIYVWIIVGNQETRPLPPVLPLVPCARTTGRVCRRRHVGSWELNV